MEGDARSWLERNVTGLTIGLVALVFLLGGLLLGRTLGDGDPHSVPATASETTQPAAPDASVSAGSSSTTAPAGATTATNPAAGSTTSTLPPYLTADPHPEYQFHPFGMQLGLMIDLDTMTPQCSDGCDVEVVEIFGVTGDEYTAVILPINGAEIVQFPLDEQSDLILALSECRDGGIGLEPYKVAAPLYQAQLDTYPFSAYWYCVRTGAGNWALLLASLGGDAPGGLFGLTAIPPGWTFERVVDVFIP